MVAAILAALVISLLTHEFAHMVFVRAFGGRVCGFRLSFLGATAWVIGLEKLKLWQRYAVYIAGPVANALLALGAWVAARFAWGQSGFVQAAFLYNVVLCAFNMLPVLPLDGGRLLQLFLGNRMGVLRANRILLKAGSVAGGALMALGLVQAVLYPWNLSLLCAGMFIRRKNKQLPLPLYWECIKALQAKDRSKLPTKKIILPKDTPVFKAVEYLGWDYWAEIHIGDGYSVSRIISEEEIMKSLHLTAKYLLQPPL